MNRPALALGAFALISLALPAHARPPTEAEPEVSTEPAPTPAAVVSSDPAADANASVDEAALPAAAPAGEPRPPAAAPAPPELEPTEPSPAGVAIRPLRRARPIAMTGIRIFGADGRCLDVQGGKHTTGAPVVLAACHGKADQRWSFTPGGRIRGAGGHCLDVAGRSSDDVLIPGADAVMKRCDGQEPDQAFVRTAGGELRVHGDNCLSLDRPATPAVVRVEVRPCDGAPDQRWYLGAPPVATPVRVSEGDGHCPIGYEPLPVDEATAAAEALCPLLGQANAARLADGGSIDGPSQGCGVRVEDPRPLEHTLCRPARGKPHR